MTGDLYIFGENTNQYFGDIPHKKNEKQPKAVKFSKIKDSRVKSFCTSGEHSIFVTNKEELLGWGMNKYSQLNSGSSEHFKIPKNLDIKFLKSRNPEYHNESLKQNTICSNLNPNFKSSRHSLNVVPKLDALIPISGPRHVSVNDNQIQIEKMVKRKGHIGEPKQMGFAEVAQRKFIKSLTNKSINSNFDIQCGLAHSQSDRKLPKLKNYNIMQSKRESGFANESEVSNKSTEESTIANLNNNLAKILNETDNSTEALTKNYDGRFGPLQQVLEDASGNSSGSKIFEKNDTNNILENNRTAGTARINSKNQKSGFRSVRDHINQPKNKRPSMVNMYDPQRAGKNQMTEDNDGKTSNSTQRKSGRSLSQNMIQQSQKNINAPLLKIRNLGIMNPSMRSVNQAGMDIIHMIDCNSHCTYFATKKGCFSIGNKESGLLGFENTSQLLNNPVPIDLDMKIQIEGVSANRNHVLIWDNDGQVYGWGSNKFGKLGVANNMKQSNVFYKKPQRISILANKKVISAQAGNDSSFIITNKGKIFFWGKPFVSLSGKGLLYQQPTLLKTPEQFNKVTFLKQINYDYNYATLDMNGRVFTFGNNFNDNLGYNHNDKKYIFDQANYVHLQDEYITFDISMSEKNLVVICFARGYKNEKIFYSTPVVVSYMQKIRRFLGHEIGQQREFANMFDEVGENDDSMADANNSSNHHGNMSPSYDQSSEQLNTFENQPKDISYNKIHEMSSILSDRHNESTFEKKSKIINSGILQLPFQPRFKKKFASDQSLMTDLNNDISDIIHDYINSYRHYIQTEIDKNKSNSYVSLLPENEMSQFGVLFNLTGKTNDSIIINEKLNELTTLIREKVFGELNQIDEIEEFESLRHEIEQSAVKDLSQIYLNSVRNGKESEIIQYIMSKSSHKDEVRKKIKAPFTGISDNLYKQNRHIFGIAVEKQKKARENHIKSTSIVNFILEDIKKTYRQKQTAQFSRIQREHTQVLPSAVKTEYLSSDQRLIKIKQMNRCTNEKITEALKIKDKNILEKVRNHIDEIEDKNRRYTERVEFRKKMKSCKNVTIMFMKFILINRACYQIKRLIYITKARFHDQKDRLDSVIYIQRWYRKKTVNGSYQRDHTSPDKKKFVHHVQLKNTLYKKNIRNIMLFFQLKEAKPLILFPCIMRVSFIRKIQRFVRKKQDVKYFERCILAFKMNKIINKNCQKDRPKEFKELSVVKDEKDKDKDKDKEMNLLLPNMLEAKYIYMPDIMKNMEKIQHDYNLHNTIIENKKEGSSIFNVFLVKYKKVCDLTVEFKKLVGQEDLDVKNLPKTFMFWKDVYINLYRECLPFTDECKVF